MKLVVYAIAKDEKQTARAWAEAAREADEIVVLDTGSTDGTPEILREAGAKVYQDFDGPFRFDRARNQALNHVPTDADWCFSADIDEIFEPGWRAAIEKAAAENPLATQIKYPFIFTHRTDPATGKEIDEHVFYKGNCHRRTGWRWVCPCHEVLTSELTPIEASAEGCRLHHRSYPKQRRENYLKLLEDGAREDPKDPRVHYYLGREYFYRGQYETAAETLVQYLDLAGQFGWQDEKGNAVLMIAECCARTGDLDRAESWGLRAIALTAGREPYLFLSKLYSDQKRWWESRFYADQALRIANNNAYFRAPEAYRERPWDLIAMASYELGDKKRGKEAAQKCLDINPTDERIRKNARFFGITPPELPKTAETGEKFDAGKHAYTIEIPDEKKAFSVFSDENRDRNREEELAVAYSITRNFTEHLEVALYTLLRHNRLRDLYVIIEGGQKAEPISALARRFRVRRVHWIDLDRLLRNGFRPESPNLAPLASKATYGRLFLARETKEEKIIYLDTDTVVKGSLAGLWNQPFDGAAMIGVKDAGIHKGDCTRALAYGGIPDYINTGVVLLNLELIRALRLDTQALDILNTYYQPEADQDALNTVCKGRVRHAPVEFNSGRACGISAEPIVEHFACIREWWRNPECASWQTARAEYESWLRSSAE